MAYLGFLGLFSIYIFIGLRKLIFQKNINNKTWFCAFGLLIVGTTTDIFENVIILVIGFVL